MATRGGSRGGGSSSGGGSRGGSRGGSSSFRGSSNSGGSSSFGGGGRVGGVHRPRRPRYFHVGPRYYVISTGRQTALSFLVLFLIISIFAIIVGVVMGSGAKSDIKLAKDDRAYYLMLISQAEAGQNNHIVILPGANLTLVQTLSDDASDNYAVRYTIIYTPVGSGLPVTKTRDSFYVYDSLVDANNALSLGVAVNTANSNGDSMPVSYKNYELEDDAFYQTAKSKEKNGTIIMWSGVGVVAFCVVAGAWTTLSKSSTKSEAESANGNPPNSTPNADTQTPNTNCPYCGARFGPDDKNCSNCGAARK